MPPIRVTSEKLDAAEYVYKRAKGWVFCDSILDNLREHDRENVDIAVVRVKVPLLNTLYQTNLRATLKMANHIVTLMRVPQLAGAALVEAMSAPPIEGRTRHFRSFASKFCHFFVNREEYPIMDSRNTAALASHLSHNEYSARAIVTNYELFWSGLRSLRGRDSISISPRNLDHYLYLWQVLREYRAGRPVAEEIRELFAEAERSKGELGQAVEVLGKDR